jgi:DNA-binding transcriptional ArsR family regulator
MNAESISRIASLVGEPGRIRMLTTLLDGDSHSASELALAAAVSAQAASSHLSKLKRGGLIVVENQGRQRLFRLKNDEVAVAIEALGALAPNSDNTGMPELRIARTCYDHLAGVLSIAVRDQLLKRDVLRRNEEEFTLTRNGERFLRRLEIDAESLRGLRRSLSRKCLDWTERHHHLGGALGAALLSHFFEMKWLVRMRDTRAVRITLEGEHQLERVFGIRCAALRKAR